MEVMQRAVVKNRTLKPLPGEITDARIRDATLPLKVEAARRAIAACTDLPELLQMKSQAEALAAAVRVMKDIGPEMIHAATQMVADSWRKGGELLKQYSNAPQRRGIKGVGGRMTPSQRMTVGRSLGLADSEIGALVRVSDASESLVAEVLSVTNYTKVRPVAQRLPAARQEHIKTGVASRGTKYTSDAAREIMRRLSSIASHIKFTPLDAFAQLTPDERKIVKAKITEIVELLDEMDRLCR